MPAFLNWLLRLGPTNPIAARIAAVGSRQMRHLYIRAGYLALMITVLLFTLLGQGSVGTLSFRELAGAGANMFLYVSYLQVGLICVITPVFMAGAIAQEANPKTWDILLTTPLNDLQIVLGNLLGRLFFVVALLFSSLPLFVMTQYFGGVPGSAIFASYAIAGCSALVVAACAITLCVTRTAGRRAVFAFYVSVIMYLFATAGLDVLLRSPVPNVPGAFHTSVLTPLNPFLALRVLLESNQYVPVDFTGTGAGPIARWWLGRPISAFCWTCGAVALFLVTWSTLRLRTIGARTGSVPWYRRMFGLGAKGATERPARTVGTNPIVWRESVARGRTLGVMLARWGFLAAGVVVALLLLLLYHTGGLDHGQFRTALLTVVVAETVIIALAALNTSATAVSREREDGSLDIILTTPIQPGPYLRGKLVGLLQYLVPMMLVPTVTVGLTAIYVLTGGFGRADGVTVSDAVGAGTIVLPVMLPEAAVALPVMLVAFTAFCVMVGLHWSIRSKGTVVSVVAAFGVVAIVVATLGLCGNVGGREMSVPGALLATTSPLNLVLGLVHPASHIPSALEGSVTAARWTLVTGAMVSAAIYAAVSFAMHANMKRTFMMTVRRLAGTG